MSSKKQVNEKHSQSEQRKFKLVQFFRETVWELKRIHWPRRREVINYTAATFILFVVFFAAIYFFDMLIQWLLSLIGVL